MREEQIFHDALLQPPDCRSAFLSDACAGEAALQEQVERLLRAHENPGGFLQAPNSAAVATLAYAPATSVGTLIGPYKIREQIGEGGMGEVYVAEQMEPVRRKVALKIIRPGMATKEVVARFEAERQALALMDHPHIARIFDGGATDAGQPYFVMELVQGPPITEYCDAHRLPTHARLELLVKVCRAVQHAHQKGIIHRDLKPSNVLVPEIDGAAVPKVIDFGVAKAVDQRLTPETVYTHFSQLVGTPLYMSPEQAGLGVVDIDTRSDVYSLGVLLYELLSGKTPFDSQALKQAGFEEMQRIIREVEPCRPSVMVSTLDAAALSTVAVRRGSDHRKLSESLRGELDWIVMKALEKDRDRRYETASALAADIERYVNDQPIEARRASAWYRASKFARRNKARLALAAGVLVVIAVCGANLAWSLRAEALSRTQLKGEIQLALREAELLQGQKKWPEALAVVTQTRGRLPMAGIDLSLRRVVDQRVVDLQMAARLEAIRSELLNRIAESEGAWSELEDLRTDADYARAFAEYGIDVRKLDMATAADRIRRRGIRMELAAALDDWSTSRHYSAGKDDAFWRSLQELATAVDPDPVRMRLRLAWKKGWQGMTPAEMDALSTSPEVLAQPARVLLSLGLRFFPPSHWERVLRELHRRHPDDFWINLELASQLSPQNPVEAARFATAAIALRPDSATAHLELGTALAEQGKPDDALAELCEALRLGGDFAAVHNNLAAVLERKGLVDEALAEYREALRHDPQDAQKHINFGLALAKNGRLDEAIQEFREGTRLRPDDAATRHDLGRALLLKGLLDDAIAELREAIRLQPGLIQAHYSLAQAWDRKGLADEAAAEYRETIRLGPGHVAALNDLAWLLARRAECSAAEAKESVALAQKAGALSPKSAMSAQALGAAHYRDGQHQAAIEALNRSIELQGDGGDAYQWILLAMAHWQLFAAEDVQSGESSGTHDPANHRAQALDFYQQAVAWMESNQPAAQDLIALRAEVAALLGVKNPPDDKPPTASPTTGRDLTKHFLCFLDRSQLPRESGNAAQADRCQTAK